MTIKSSGTLSFSEIAAEFGGSNPLVLSNYYGLGDITKTSGSISFSDFYGKTFFVIEYIRITDGPTWTPIPNLARFLHIFVIGAGGSGGAGWPNRSLFSDGIAVASGGGAGGVAYSRIVANSITSATVTVGSGGAPQTAGGEGRGVNGNNGTSSSFVGGGLNMVAGGGGGGLGLARSDGGSTSGSVAGAAGGNATGGNIANFVGGSSGSCTINVTGVGQSASGGGAPAFQASHNALKNSANASGPVATAGAKVSSYGSWPFALYDYPLSRNQGSVMNASSTTFDGSDGLRGGTVSGESVLHGGGSGGKTGENTTVSTSGRGGNGLIIIIYEI